MGLNETYSNSNETWSAGSSRPKTTMEHHLLAIQSPQMGLWCPTEAIMHFLKFLGLIPLCAARNNVLSVPSRRRIDSDMSHLILKDGATLSYIYSIN